jgi:hypothetical protein
MENNTELLLEILEEEYEAYDSLEEMLHEEREILIGAVSLDVIARLGAGDRW